MEKDSSKLEILKATKGRLLTDNYEFVPAFDSNKVEFDSNAIKVIFIKDSIKYHFGYVPRYYSYDLTELLRKNVEYSAMIRSLNFESEINGEDITAFVKLIFNK